MIKYGGGKKTKMTVLIDDDLLKRVMSYYEHESKTEAINTALSEMDRLARLAEFSRNGLGFTPEELRDSVEPGYDVDALRVAEMPGK